MLSVRYGRCCNLISCSVAEARTVLRFGADEPFYCPECARLLVPAPEAGLAGRRAVLPILATALLAAGAAWGGYALATRYIWPVPGMPRTGAIAGVPMVRLRPPPRVWRTMQLAPAPPALPPFLAEPPQIVDMPSVRPVTLTPPPPLTRVTVLSAAPPHLTPFTPAPPPPPTVGPVPGVADVALMAPAPVRRVTVLAVAPPKLPPFTPVPPTVAPIPGVADIALKVAPPARRFAVLAARPAALAPFTAVAVEPPPPVVADIPGGAVTLRPPAPVRQVTALVHSPPALPPLPAPEEAPPPGGRVVVLPAGSRLAWGPLQGVNLPAMPTHMMFVNPEDTRKPGNIQVDCKIGLDGVPADCRKIAQKGGADVSETILAWLASGAIRYSPATRDGHAVVERRVLTVNFGKK